MWRDEPHLRPVSELEADVLRLTTKLMMREREFRQTKLQMSCQLAKTQQVAASWKAHAEKQEARACLIIKQRDREMREIVLQLFRFQTDLKKEQHWIEELLQEKEEIITKQKLELVRLKHSLSNFVKNENRKTGGSSHLETRTAPDATSTTTTNDKNTQNDSTKQNHSSKKSVYCDNVVHLKHLGRLRQHVIHDLTNVLKTEYPRSQLHDDNNQVSTNKRTVGDDAELRKRLLLKLAIQMSNRNSCTETEESMRCKENASCGMKEIPCLTNEVARCKSNGHNEFNISKGHNALSMKGIQILSTHSMQL
ncbi:uncharacterized protein LOC143243785 [Tachypleus tridentatus]|uniref:uncharacterized protein LOC143243785 n=1 Tax=Tachypleus tridentatus TaxID=6853 RepID=UPI003FD38AE7